jgi:hypothetical protein
MTVIRTRRIDLKQAAIDKFDSLIKEKYKLLKTDTIWFEKSEGDISHTSCLDGYNIFYRHNGTRVFPRAVNGRELLLIINAIKNNDFYGFIKLDNQRCKVRPKRQR